MAWSKLAHGAALLRRSGCDSLADQLSEHPDEPPVGSHGPRTNHEEPQLLASVPGLEVEVVEDFHVVGQKANRVDDDLGRFTLFQVAKVIEDVGLEPGVLGPPAPALIDQRPVMGRNAKVRGH